MNEHHYYEQAISRAREGDFRSAIPFGQKALEINPAWDEAHFLMGQCLMMLNEFKTAILHYQQAIGIDSNWASPYAGMGDCLRMTKDYKGAIVYYRQALSLNEKIAPAYIGMGECMTMSGQFEEAILWYRKYIDLVPTDHQPYFGLGECHRMLQRFAEARSCYLKALELGGKDEMTMNRVGICYKEEKNFEDALQSFQRCIDVYPKKAEGYYNIGECYRLMGKFEKCLPYFKTAISYDPDYFLAYTGYGEVLRRTNFKWEAIGYFTTAIEKGDQSDRPYYGIGECYRFLQEYDKAIETFKQALNRNGDEADLYCKIGECYNFQLKFDEAARYFHQSIELNPKNESTYCGLGEGYCRQGMVRKGLDYLLKGEIFRKKGSRRSFLSLANYLLYVSKDEDLQYALDQIQLHFKDRIVDLSGHEVSFRKYMYAKIFLQEAATIYNDDYFPYLCLLKIPRQYFSLTEPAPVNYFYHLCLAWRSTPNALHASTKKEIFEHALKYEIPLTAIDILLDENEELEIVPMPVTLSDVLSKTMFVRQQMTVWKESLDTIEKINLWAIFSYHLHNPVAAYDLYDQIAGKTDGAVLDTIGHYYFSLAARDVMAPHQSFFEDYTIPFIRQRLTIPKLSDSEKYYCGLILQLAGDPEGIMILENLKNTGNKAASYKLAEYKLHTCHEVEATSIIAELSAAWNASSDYFRSPSIIEVSSDAHKVLNEIRPLLDVVENEITLQYIFDFQAGHSPGGISSYNYFNDLYFFAGKLQFPHLVPEEEKVYYNKTLPQIYEQVYGSDEEQDMLEPEIRYYKELAGLQKDVVNHIGEKIHAYSYTKYSYLKHKIDDAAPQIGFRYYLLLISRCLEERLLSNEETAILQEYTKYCAGQIKLVKPDNEILQYAYEEVVGFIKAAVQLHAGIEYIERACKMVRSRVSNNESELISFSKYLGLVLNRQ